MATKEITISDGTFTVNLPYEPGPRELTPGEARTLNQARCEGIRNNLAKKVKELLTAGDNTGATQLVAQYDNEFQFAMPGSGTGRTVRDPLEREVRAIIRDSLKVELAKEGKKLKDVDEDKIEEIIERNSSNPEVIKLAKKRVAAKQASAAIALEGVSVEASPSQ